MLSVEKVIHAPFPRMTTPEKAVVFLGCRKPSLAARQFLHPLLGS